MAKMRNRSTWFTPVWSARLASAGGISILGAMLVSCAQPRQYFGIPLTAQVTQEEQARLAEALGEAESEPASGPCRWHPAGQQRAVAIPCESVPLVAIARAAQGRNKHAQLELGVRFEEGNGLERDLQKALKLYRKAGENSRSGAPVSAPNYSGSLLNNPQVGVVDTTQPSMMRNHYPGYEAPRGLPEARARFEALTQRMPEP